MNDEEFKKKISEQKLIGADFFEGAFKFWFEDNKQFKCPFPEWMHDELKKRSYRKFMEWVIELEDEKIKSQNLSDKYGDIVEEIALSLAETEDEKISILYPELPRVGDLFHDHDNYPNNENMIEIIERFAVKEDNKWIAIKIKFDRPDENGDTETEFELE